MSNLDPAIRKLARRLYDKRRRSKPIAQPLAPADFAQKRLRIELWEKQVEVLECLSKHHRVAVRSGHKVGKSCLAAVAAYWWTQYPNAQVIITTPTNRQVRRIVWREIGALGNKSLLALPEIPKDPGTGIQWKDGRSIIGFSTDTPENIAGFSGTRLLFIVDEASGVDDRIFEAIEGNTAGGAADDESSVAKILLLGNGTRNKGAFYNAFNKHKAFWKNFHIPSWESPNVKAGRVVVPGLATREYCEDKLDKWGADSYLYQVRVAGNFPSQDQNSVIPQHLINTEGFVTPDNDEQIHIGVDPARFGDDASEVVVAIRRGLVAIHTFNQMDQVDLAGKVVEIAESFKSPYPVVIKVDSVGLGSGVASILHRRSGVVVLEVNNAAAPADKSKYLNLRAEIMFRLKDYLNEGFSLVDDTELIEDLSVPTYKFALRGGETVVQIESKDDIKKRIGRSPGKGDATCLASYQLDQVFEAPGAAPVTAYRNDFSMRGY